MCPNASWPFARPHLRSSGVAQRFEQSAWAAQPQPAPISPRLGHQLAYRVVRDQRRHAMRGRWGAPSNFHVPCQQFIQQHRAQVTTCGRILVNRLTLQEHAMYPERAVCKIRCRSYHSGMHAHPASAHAGSRPSILQVSRSFLPGQACSAWQHVIGNAKHKPCT
jgi:hypothetical protein